MKLYPKKIIYVSCDPATLSRDMKLILERRGNATSVSEYSVKNIQPVDMFPQTAHIECVAVLERKKFEVGCG